MKKLISIALFAILITMTAILSGCSGEAKQFSKAGMTITLTSAFKEKKIENSTAYYVSKNVALFILKEEKVLLEESGYDADMSLKEYADLCKTNNDISYAKVYEENGLLYFAFTDISDGKYYNNFMCVFKSNDAFWVFYFMCKLDDYEELLPSFKKWAGSIKFNPAQ